MQESNEQDPQIARIKEQLAAAAKLTGFADWSPPVDVPHLDRPRARPADWPGTGKIAAVMMLIYPAADDEVTAKSASNGARSTDIDVTASPLDQLRIVLTKRHARLSKHASQISLPGGRKDSGETLVQTAVRETEEEIGVASSQIELLGQLNSVFIPPSDFTVTPFVGWSARRPQFVLSEHEVDQIIEAPIGFLARAETLVSGEVTLGDGRQAIVPYYEIPSYFSLPNERAARATGSPRTELALKKPSPPHQVWGATAIMLAELLARLAQAIGTARW